MVTARALAPPTGGAGTRSWYGRRPVKARSLPAWIALLLALMPPAAGAGTAGADPVVRVPVADTGAAARDAALRQALAMALVRHTGDRAVTEREAVRAALARAAAYVRAYRYLRGPPSAGGEGTAEPAGEAPPLALEVQLDGEALERLVARLGLAVWPRPAPALLAWVAVDEGGRRTLLTDAGSGALAAPMREAAGARGVPFLLPLGDVEDLARLEVADVWGGFWDRVLAASARYAPAAVLLGRVRPVRSGAWHGRWAVRVGGGAPVAWEAETPDLGGQLAAAVDTAVDVMAARLTRPPEVLPEGAVVVVVEGVDGLEAYARALDALGRLPGVTGVQVAAAEGTRLRLQVQARGGRPALAEALAGADLLEPVAETPPAAGVDLHLRLRP